MIIKRLRCGLVNLMVSAFCGGNWNDEDEVDMIISIRDERPVDVKIIAELTEAAFKSAAHASGTEHFIVDALRDAGQLTISMVAEENGEIVGHIAISPVTVEPAAAGWYGLGPISVWPDKQGLGIGSMLMKSALLELERRGAEGCVLLGDPNYYGRFGFKAHMGLTLPDVPQEYFQVLSFVREVPVGLVEYHRAFEATS